MGWDRLTPEGKERQRQRARERYAAEKALGYTLSIAGAYRGVEGTEEKHSHCVRCGRVLKSDDFEVDQFGYTIDTTVCMRCR